MSRPVLRLAVLFVLVGGVLYGAEAVAVAEDTTDRAVDIARNVTDPQLVEADVEHEIYREINEERRAHGLEPLERHDALDRAARGHSRDLLLSGAVGHAGRDGSDATERVSREGVRCRAGENVAANYFDSRVRGPTGETEMYRTEEELAESTVAGWMNSTGHRENILRERWETTGVGVAASAERGEAKVIVTQVFCS